MTFLTSRRTVYLKTWFVVNAWLPSFRYSTTIRMNSAYVIDLNRKTVNEENTVESRFNEITRDWPNLFINWRVHYIGNIDITNLRGNEHNVRYIEVIVNDWFLTQSGDFCWNTLVSMSMTCDKLLTEKLLSLDLCHNDFTIRICWLLTCTVFVCCCVLNIQCVDIVICYIEVDFTFRLLE